MRQTSKLTQFNGLTVDEVQEMVNKMQAKTCDSHPVPIKVFIAEREFPTSLKVATI